jgi:primary-amine oxidase
VDEMTECELAVINNEEFKHLLLKYYGVSNTKLVMVDIWSAGYYGKDEERSYRLARPLCFLRLDPSDNGYAHPIEGLRPVVDLNTMKVLRIEDYGIHPLPSLACNYSAEKISTSFRTDIKPLEIIQPKGPSYNLTNNFIEWQKWSMVIGFNAREGLTLHDIRYSDRGNSRILLFKASLTEMVVPYGDPKLTQCRKNAFDVGEYGMGTCTNSLRYGCDCVGHISYIDGYYISSRGQVVTIPNAICVHEEDDGILWKHTDRRLPDTPEVRRSRRLVISTIATVENYEYGYFWYVKIYF